MRARHNETKKRASNNVNSSDILEKVCTDLSNSHRAISFLTNKNISLIDFEQSITEVINVNDSFETLIKYIITLVGDLSNCVMQYRNAPVNGNNTNPVIEQSFFLCFSFSLQIEAISSMMMEPWISAICLNHSFTSMKRYREKRCKTDKLPHNSRLLLNVLSDQLESNLHQLNGSWNHFQFIIFTLFVLAA